MGSPSILTSNAYSLSVRTLVLREKKAEASLCMILARMDGSDELALDLLVRASQSTVSSSRPSILYFVSLFIEWLTAVLCCSRDAKVT